MQSSVRTRGMVAAVVFGLGLGASAGLLPHHGLQAQGPFRIQAITDDLYLVSGEGGNVALYVTDEGLILVDDMYARNYDALMEQIRTVTSQPVRYVLNTHQHDDHAGGNGLLPPEVEVVAHENVRANMANPDGVTTGAEGPLRPPRLTFSDEAIVHLGGKEVRSRHHGRGHTSGDAVVFFPAERVVHTGDLYLSRRPGATSLSLFIDSRNGGSLLEWGATLDSVLALDFDTVIPGHGALSDRAGVEAWQRDLATMQTDLQGLVRGGASADDVAKRLLDRWGWPDGGLALQQLDALIAELRQ